MTITGAHENALYQLQRVQKHWLKLIIHSSSCSFNKCLWSTGHAAPSGHHGAWGRQLLLSRSVTSSVSCQQWQTDKRKDLHCGERGKVAVLLGKDGLRVPAACPGLTGAGALTASQPPAARRTLTSSASRTMGTWSASSVLCLMNSCQHLPGAGKTGSRRMHPCPQAARCKGRQRCELVIT